MENSTLTNQITNLGYLPSEELITAVKELHLQRVPASTIKKAFLKLEKVRRETAKNAVKLAKETAAAAKLAASAPAPGTA